MFQGQFPVFATETTLLLSLTNGQCWEGESNFRSQPRVAGLVASAIAL